MQGCREKNPSQYTGNEKIKRQDCKSCRFPYT